MSYLRTIKDVESIITPISNGVMWPDSVDIAFHKYSSQVDEFKKIVIDSNSTEEVLRRIRSTDIPAEKRMTFLKIFRRCACLIIDTEKAKKVSIPTELLIKNYSSFFKETTQLKKEFSTLSDADKRTLCSLISEYDTRGKSGYDLTEQFFTWFEAAFPEWKIIGPRRAGPDAQLSKHLKDFRDDCPCDFIIWDNNGKLRAIGFARYDATRGGAQADDRTGGNAHKVDMLRRHFVKTKVVIKAIFIADGPGLSHKDTWEESCRLDESWEDNVRVCPLKLCEARITPAWLLS